MNYFMIVEPLIQNAYWCNRYIEGIKNEIIRGKGKLLEISLKDTSEAVKYAKEHKLRPVIMVNCISRPWIDECVHALTMAGIHPVLLAPYSSAPTMPVSTVSFDFKNVFYTLCQYLFDAGRKNIVLFGINPNSENDISKKNSFLSFAKDYGVETPEDRIFWNKGNLEVCCNKLHNRIDTFNSIVCSNDVVAVKLISYFKSNKVRVPEDVYIATMGNTALSRFITPDITVCDFDCEQIGRHAVKMSSILAKNPDVSTINAMVSGKIEPRRSTDFSPVGNISQRKFASITSEVINFYSDSGVNKIFCMEQLVSKCDSLDITILYGLICAKPVSQLAEETFCSENTIKYRIRKMQSLSNTNTRKELVDLFADFLY